MKKIKKYLPKIGEGLYLSQRTGNYYVDMVKRPYTVIGVTSTTITIQRAKLIAPVYHCVGNPWLDRPDLEGQRVFFYDTIAESIEPDLDGEIKTLHWSNKKGKWQHKHDPYDRYPEFAFFGEGYQHQPYLN